MQKITLARFAAMVSLLASGALAQQVKPVCTEDNRACMIATATTYLEAIVHHDGSKVPFAPDVRRTEQSQDTGRGETEIRDALLKMPAMTGYHNTRFIVDEPNHQLVYFTLLSLEKSPVTVHLAERFRIEHGLIREIEAIFTAQSGTSDGQSGWPDSAK